MQEIMKALAWTFVHSLWQGFIAALLVAAIISATSKSKARLRYNLLGLVFLLFISVAAITFIIQFNQIDSSAEIASTLGGNELASTVATGAAIITAGGFIADLTNWFNNNSGLLLLIWVLFF